MAIIIGGGSGNAISIASNVGSANQVITSDGTNSLWAAGGFSGLNGRFYTAPGTFIVGTDCPSAITFIKITGCGGGGSGGPGAGPSYVTGYPGAAGGGGGGGSRIQVFFRTVSNSQTYTLTIGGAPGGTTTVAFPGPTALFTMTGGGNGGGGEDGYDGRPQAGGTPGTTPAVSPLSSHSYGNLTPGGGSPGGNGSPQSVGSNGTGGRGALNYVFNNGAGGAGGTQSPGGAGVAGFCLIEW